MTAVRFPLTCALALAGLIAACGGEVSSQDTQDELASAPTGLMDQCPDDTCGGGGGGGGPTTPPPPPYNLQGVIQNEGTEGDGVTPHRARVKIRAYSRLATWGNDRRDANYISVNCTASDPFGPGYTSASDSENNGALVDVTFYSNFVTGEIPQYRTITVTCQHHATKDGRAYDTTSTAQIVIPY